MGYAADMITNILREGIEGFAKRANLKPSQVQLVITTEDNETCQPMYKLYNDWKPTKRKQPEGEPNANITFLDILHVEIDMLNREQVAGPTLAMTLARISQEELHCKPSQVFIVIFTNDDEFSTDKKQVHPYVLLRKVTDKVEDIRYLDIEKDIVEPAEAMLGQHGSE